MLLLLGRRGQPAVANERFDRPTDVAFAANGDVYISDGYGNSRVVKYNKHGDYLTEWGKKGIGQGEFNLPHAIVTDKAGRVYVADRENFRVQIFDADGKFLEQWTHVGSPFGFAMSDDGFLFIADGYNDRVLKLDLDGKILGSIGRHGRAPGRFDVVHHLAVARAAASTQPRSSTCACNASRRGRAVGSHIVGSIVGTVLNQTSECNAIPGPWAVTDALPCSHVNGSTVHTPHEPKAA